MQELSDFLEQALVVVERTAIVLTAQPFNSEPDRASAAALITELAEQLHRLPQPVTDRRATVHLRSRREPSEIEQRHRAIVRRGNALELRERHAELLCRL